MGVSVEWFSDIAETLGLTRPALYNYFADREDLQYRCYLMACDELGQRFEVARASHEDPVDVLTGFLAINLSAAPELAILSEIAALRPEQRDAVMAQQEPLVARIAEEVHRGIDAGRIRDLTDGNALGTLYHGDRKPLPSGSAYHEVRSRINQQAHTATQSLDMQPVAWNSASNENKGN